MTGFAAVVRPASHDQRRTSFQKVVPRHLPFFIPVAARARQDQIAKVVSAMVDCVIDVAMLRRCALATSSDGGMPSEKRAARTAPSMQR